MAFNYYLYIPKKAMSSVIDNDRENKKQIVFGDILCSKEFVETFEVKDFAFDN